MRALAGRELTAEDEAEQVKKDLLQEFGMGIINRYFNKQRAVVNPLLRHDIPWSTRVRMVDWMIEVTSTFKLDERTFFLSVAIMDNYLAEE